ncbi:hypothetical protein [Syntrophomonas wolfei]|uniref:Uncharacterized protein n=1 Tax=Syntrophomonas wolfei subsp. wolfei (strain DSM 2245B / Goettingen) TaxID=335541 RepID=Q0AZF0_SYNWW|nr:hypothetical protein [Syntrophomonas wolfei]ABI67904.1 hypothetical protein Swol_0571 [Syntrophomonas wolfei subsp. wolfei str. Goettingen G311]
MSEIKVAINNVRISKINAVLTEKKNETSDASLRRNTVAELDPVEECSYVLRILEKIDFQPTGPMMLELETLADITTSSNLEDKNLIELKKELADMVMTVNTLTIAFISEKMLSGPPIIIPPFLEVDETVVYE